MAIVSKDTLRNRIRAMSQTAADLEAAGHTDAAQDAQDQADVFRLELALGLYKG
ncbi:MAG TPA: hypothetical protein VFU47_15925 [Armatimonadota bacterium]|nr:hypothetical protein [Armatimonadota bacterium]